MSGCPFLFPPACSPSTQHRPEKRENEKKINRFVRADPIYFAGSRPDRTAGLPQKIVKQLCCQKASKIKESWDLVTVFYRTFSSD